MSTNGDAETPEPDSGAGIKNGANQELVTFVGNLIVEARQQVIALRTLYDALRELVSPAPKLWAYKLVESQEAHVDRVNQHISGLKSSLG